MESCTKLGFFYTVARLYSKLYSQVVHITFCTLNSLVIYYSSVASTVAVYSCQFCESKGPNCVDRGSGFIRIMTSDGLILETPFESMEGVSIGLLISTQRLWVGFPGLYYTQHDSQQPKPQHIYFKTNQGQPLCHLGYF